MVNDFLQAATSADSNYAVAKKFLTAKAAQNWDPTKSVLVREKPATPQDIGDNTVDYAVSTRASVNALGVYVRAEHRFDPDAVVQLHQSERAVAHQRPARRHRAVSNQLRELVPAATRSTSSIPTTATWCPTCAGSRPASPCRTGSSRRFSVARRTGCSRESWPPHSPRGCSPGRPYRVTNSTATVDFGATAASVKEPTLARMQRQLEESLAVLAITNVAMTARGAPLPVAESQQSHAEPAVSIDPAALIQKGKQFGFYPGLQAIPGISAPVVALNGSAATVDRGQANAAVLATGGVYLVSSAGTKLVDARPGLIAPSIDTFGYVWSVPSNDAVRHPRDGPRRRGPPDHVGPPAGRDDRLARRVARRNARARLPRDRVRSAARRRRHHPSCGPSDLARASCSTCRCRRPSRSMRPGSIRRRSPPSHPTGGVDTVISYVIGGSPSDATTHRRRRTPRRRCGLGLPAPDHAEWARCRNCGRAAGRTSGRSPPSWRPSSSGYPHDQHAR